MKNEPVITNKIESRIFTIRGQRVMIDSDLACLYDIETFKGTSKNFSF